MAVYTDDCPNHPDSLVAFYDSGQLNGAHESMTVECMSERGNFPTVLDLETVDVIEGQNSLNYRRKHSRSLTTTN